MAGTEANLPSAKDLAVVDPTVFPLEVRPDLAREASDGLLLLSARGVQFYTTAFRRAGVSVDLAVIRTKSELHIEVMRASGALCVEADAGMRVELDAGRIPAQGRKAVRAYMDGSAQEFMAAAERWEQCAAAGGNVIPVEFGKCAAKTRGPCTTEVCWFSAD
jgi:hypothetical protein